MKTKVMLSAAVALTAVLGLSSCTGADAKLAGDITGTWKGQPTAMKGGKPDKEGHKGNPDKGMPGEMTCTPTITFVRTDGTNGGTLTISADYTMTKGVESVTTTTPVKASLSGNVSASGTWTVKDDDEIAVVIDPAKTEVTVDPSSLSVSYASLTDAPQDSLTAVKERVAANVTDVITPMITGRLQRLHEFDDVKVTGNSMTLEIGHNKINFSRQ